MPGNNKCKDCKKICDWYFWSETTNFSCNDCAKQTREAAKRDKDNAREMEARKVELEAITEREKNQLRADVDKKKEETKQAEAATKLKVAIEQTKQKKAEEAVMEKRVLLEQERRKCIQAEESRDRAQAEKLAHCSKIVATLSNMGTSELFVRQLLRQMLGGNADKEENEQNLPATPYQPKINRTQSVKT